MIFKNNNGHEYLILDEDKDIMLLAQLDSRKFVVAVGVGKSSWCSGAYFNCIEEALNRFKEGR